MQTDLYTLGVLRFLWAMSVHSRPASEPALKHFTRRVEYVVRYFRLLRWVKDYQRLFSDPRLQFVLPAQYRILAKVRRSYTDTRWNAEKSTQVISAHYRWMAEHFSREAMEEIYLRNGFPLAEIEASGSRYEVRLQVDMQMEKEGELTLTLVNSEGLRLSNLTFVIDYREGVGHVMLIGGLQGNIKVSHDHMKKMTKDCHGMRPLALLVAAIQDVSVAWGLKEVWGVSDAVLIYYEEDMRFKSERRMTRSYDEMWRELGGVETDHWFNLGLVPHVRDPADAPSNKRAMYTRRKAMMQDMQQQIAVHAVQRCMTV